MKVLGSPQRTGALLLALSILVATVVNGQEQKELTLFGVTPENLERMKTATWTNQNEVARDVGLPADGSSPYPADDPYDVTIEAANCYVVFQDSRRTSYDMITATEPPPDPAGFGVFLSHTTPCGVCSNLADLAVYLEQPDLTNPVRLCGFTSFVSSNINKDCLVNGIGFSDLCGTIWLHNTRHSRDNCAFLCIAKLFSPNNERFGVINPCQPLKENDEENGGTCQNTINQQPACATFQYEWGTEYRLNACLQCDECNSGPLFQKIAGRTRRASGIQSGIRRPDIPSIDHNYFTS